MKIITMAIATLLILTGCNRMEPAPKDYVSGYDFKSARLVDLPWEVRSVIMGSSVSLDYNSFVREHYPDWNCVQYELGKNLFYDLSRIPKDSTNPVYTVEDPASIIPKYDSVDDSCRLADGSLWHELESRDGLVVPSTNRRFFVVSVKVLDYQDYNKDGYMDVIVFRRLPGSAAPTETLVLSRRKPEGQFDVVEHLDGSVRLGGTGSHSWQKNSEGTTESHWRIIVTSNMTVASLAKEYGVSQEVIRSANGLGKDDEVQECDYVIIPD